MAEETKVLSLEQICSVPGRRLGDTAVRKNLRECEAEDIIRGWSFPAPLNSENTTRTVSLQRAYTVSFEFLADFLCILDEDKEPAREYFNNQVSIAQSRLRQPVRQNHSNRSSKTKTPRNVNTSVITGADGHSKPFSVEFLPKLPSLDGISYEIINLKAVAVADLDSSRVAAYFDKVCVSLQSLAVCKALITNPKVLVDYLIDNETRDVPLFVLKKALGKNSVPAFVVERIQNQDSKIPLDVLVTLAVDETAVNKLIKKHQPVLIKERHVSIAGYSFNIGSPLNPNNPVCTVDEVCLFFNLQPVSAKTVCAKISDGKVCQSQLINYLKQYGDFLFVDYVVKRAMDTYSAHGKKAPFMKKMKKDKPSYEEEVEATVEKVNNMIKESFPRDAKLISINADGLFPVYILHKEDIANFFCRTGLSVYDPELGKKTPKSLSELLRKE